MAFRYPDTKNIFSIQLSVTNKNTLFEGRCYSKFRNVPLISQCGLVVSLNKTNFCFHFLTHNYNRIHCYFIFELLLADGKPDKMNWSMFDDNIAAPAESLLQSLCRADHGQYHCSPSHTSFSNKIALFISSYIIVRNVLMRHDPSRLI